MGFGLVIGFISHLQLGITSNYNDAQISIPHISLPSLLQPPLIVAWLQSSNKGYSLLQVGRSVRLLLVSASAAIPGFSLLEIHDQNICSLLHMYVLYSLSADCTEDSSSTVPLLSRCLSPR
jgi:hypothetical protein